jgi:hypothetical protein
VRVQAHRLGEVEVEAEVQPAAQSGQSVERLARSFREPAVAALRPGRLAFDREDAAGGDAVDLHGLASRRAREAQQYERGGGFAGTHHVSLANAGRGSAIPEAPRA